MLGHILNVLEAVLAFTSCFHKALSSVTDEKLGSSYIFSRHVHNPPCVWGFFDPQEHIETFQSFLWTPSFPF
jgi:hypothetical protein